VPVGARSQLPIGSAAVVRKGLDERPVGVLQLGLRAIDRRPVPCRREELGNLATAEVARARRGRQSSREKVEETVGLEVDDLSTDRELAEQKWSSLFTLA
jgi:hypothetical protein